MAKITRERALRIAKGHACSHCKEYTYKKLTVKVAPESIQTELKAAWIATKLCGVCNMESEIGIQDDGDIVFES